MIKLKEYSNSLENTLINTNLQKISVDLTEFTLDQLVDEGVLEGIPIIRSIYQVGKTAIRIRDMLFLKKIIYFLAEIKEVPKEKRKQMVDVINSSEKYRTKVGEKLLFIIDRCEDHEKAAIIAKLFKAFINEKIDYNDFLRLANIIDRIMIEDLDWFLNNEIEREFFFEDLDDFIVTGLFTFTLEDQRDRDRSLPSKYELQVSVSNIGSKLREVLK